MKTQIHHISMSVVVLLGASPSVHAVERFVAPDGGHLPPFTNWVDAATNIQDAIDVASAGDVVWVTNGIYATGGRAMAGDLTNRVALDKALTVRSVNGPEVTVIQGVWDPATTNGPLSVRCAWLTNDAMLNGFTIKGGATRSSGDESTLQNGGGLWCASTNAFVANCTISNNAGYYQGGGCYGGTLTDCQLIGNVAYTGAGAYGATLLRSRIVANSTAKTGSSGGSSTANGGGASHCYLSNCWVIGNRAGFGWAGAGGGASASTMINCVLRENACGQPDGTAAYWCDLNHCTVTGNKGGYALSGGFQVVKNSIVYGNDQNYLGSTFEYSCTTPLPNGVGNISDDPQLLADGVHLAPSSPCRGAAAANSATGADIDGQQWRNPPSMGCDEWNLNPVLLEAIGWSEDEFRFQFMTESGVGYVVEWTTSLVPPTVWVTEESVVGSGGMELITDHTATNAMRLYRVRVP